MHHENGYDVDNPAERLSVRNMSVQLYENVTYMLGNNSNTAPLMLAFEEIFQQTYTSQIHAEFMSVLSQNLTIDKMVWAFVSQPVTM